jgi:2-polyprenyl-3-methyl-5-hydroxy-6-metoxy-1,4-benzoquinol methylase
MTCRICDAEGHHRRYELREQMFGAPETFTYFECGSCGCLQIETIPVDLGRYYSSDYHSLSFSVERAFQNPIRNVGRRLRCRAAIGQGNAVGRLLLRRYPDDALASLARLRPTASTRILDVGCGKGYVLCQLFDAGITNVMGIDPFLEESITYPNGPRILKSPLTAVDGEWDIIMFHHSFEHVTNPVETLRACAERLAHRGTCVLRLPTISSYAWRHYQANWFELDPPRHVTLFSRAGLALLAERVGLVVDSVVDDSTASQFWGSEQCAQNIALMSSQSYLIAPHKSSFTSKQIRNFELRARELNARGDGDRVAVYLRKSVA